MKILLFGKNGQLGWELQRSLAPLGDVVALGSTDTGGDFRDPDALAATVRAIAPQWVVNAAAYTAVDRAESERELAFAINAHAVGVLARQVKALSAWLVQFSTDYVFDGSGDRPWTEADAPAPLNVYGSSKLEAEDLIRSTGCRHLILRTSWVYAARGNNFAKTMLALLRSRDSLSVVDDQIGAPTGAELLADVTAHACRLAAHQPELAGVYHCVAAGETSWHGYARHIAAFARRHGEPLRVEPEAIQPIRSSAYPQQAVRPKNSRLDTTKVRTAFGVSLPEWQAPLDRCLAELLGH